MSKRKEIGYGILSILIILLEFYNIGFLFNEFPFSLRIKVIFSPLILVMASLLTLVTAILAIIIIILITDIVNAVRKRY